LEAATGNTSAAWIRSNLTLDISRMHFDERILTSMEPAVQRAFADMDALESGPIANPDEKTHGGHYWLRAPQTADQIAAIVAAQSARPFILSRTSVFKWPRQDGPQHRPGRADVFAHLRMKWVSGQSPITFRELSNDLLLIVCQFARFQVLVGQALLPVRVPDRQKCLSYPTNRPITHCFLLYLVLVARS